MVLGVGGERERDVRLLYLRELGDGDRCLRSSWRGECRGEWRGERRLDLRGEWFGELGEGGDRARLCSFDCGWGWVCCCMWDWVSVDRASHVGSSVADFPWPLPLPFGVCLFLYPRPTPSVPGKPLALM